MKPNRPTTNVLLTSALTLSAALSFLGHTHAQSCVTPPSGLMYWLPGDGAANDISPGNQFHAVLQHDSRFRLPTFAPGLVDKAFSFNGGTTAAMLSRVFSRNSWTYEFWVKVSWFTNGSILDHTGSYVLDRTEPTSPLASLKAVGGKFAFQVRYDDHSGLGGPIGGSIVLNRWTHIAMVRVYASQFRLYVDGALVATSPDNGKTLTLPKPLLGRHYDQLGFAGLLDEFTAYSRSLTDAEIRSIFNAGAAGKCKPCGPPPSGLVHWLPAASVVSPFVTPDIVSRNDGTFVNANYSQGVSTFGFGFFGGSSAVKLNNRPRISSTGSWTYEFWVNVHSFTNGGILDHLGTFFLDRTQATSPLVSLKPVSGKYGFQVRYDDHSGLGGPIGGSIVPNTWTHIAMVRDYGSQFRLYVDSVLVGTTSDNGKALTPPVPKLGGHATTGTGFVGRIDEFAIYNRALAASEIRHLYLAIEEGAKCTDIVAPTAVAGPDQSFHGTKTVNLDGSSSFDDTTTSVNLAYQWSFVSVPTGSEAALANSNAAVTSFFADLPGVYLVQLIVVDEAGNVSAPDQVVISSVNIAPTANAGNDQVVVVNTAAALDGLESSDPEGDTLTYSWSIVSKPSGSNAALVNPTTATPSLTPDLVGEYVVQLVVNDGFADSPPAMVTVNAITGQQAAENEVAEASELVVELATTSFEAEGHQNDMANSLSKITKFIQSSDTDLAIKHLEKLISRTDGYALRNAPDPKGKNNSTYAADFVTDRDAQLELYKTLTDALKALQS